MSAWVSEHDRQPKERRGRMNGAVMASESRNETKSASERGEERTKAIVSDQTPKQTRKKEREREDAHFVARLGASRRRGGTRPL